MNTAKSFVYVGHQGCKYRVYVNAQTGYWFTSFEVEGHRRRESLRVKTKVEAEHAVRQLDAPPVKAETPAVNPSELTWEKFVQMYLEYKAQQNKAPKTLSRFRAGLQACGRYLSSIGIKKASDVTLAMLEGYGEFRTKREKCDVKTAYTDALVIKNAMKWGSKASRGLLKSNPAVDWETPKPVKPKRRCYTAAEVEVLENGVREWLRPVVTLLAWTGMRIGELVNLRWADVDLSKRVIHVRVQEAWKPKGRRDRVIPMHPKVEAILRRQAVGLYVIRGPNGGRLKETYALMCLKADQATLKVPEGDLHAFRRYFATSMLQAGANIDVVRQWGGWKSLDTMLRYLADVDQTSSVKVMDEAAKRLASA
jgi:integrase/recombinase XerD